MSIHLKFSTTRHRDTTVQESRSPTVEILSDKGRIITSSGFRRLQSKAQVFSLEKNAYVRTRLSHSLEVASIGVIIANKLIEKISKENKHECLQDLSALPYLIENACFLHDIGNPPFGHLGEYAIQKWFSDLDINDINVPENTEQEILNKCIENYTNFDGNAQGLRIVSKLQYLNDKFGLNLTYSTLASMIKYPNLGPPSTTKPTTKKTGIFFSEKDIFLKIWNDLLGVSVDSENHSDFRYFPSKIMEASDDISYCLSDIEDALEKGVIDQRSFFDFIDTSSSILSEEESKLIRFVLDKITAKYESIEEESKIAKFLNFKIFLTQNLVNEVVDFCVKKLTSDDFLSDEKSIIDQIPPANSALNIIKDFSQKYIFVSDEAVAIELSGFQIVKNLLDKHKCILSLKKDIIDSIINQSHKKHNKKYPLESRLLTSLPSRHVQAYQAAVEDDSRNEICYRIQLIVDYISGMTDDHALDISNKLNGAIYA